MVYGFLEPLLNANEDEHGDHKFTLEQIEVIKFFGFNDSILETGEVTDINTKIKDIERILNELPVIIFTLAIDPSVELIDRLKEFSSIKTKDSAVLFLKRDPSILGGLIIEYEGVFEDHSIKSKVESIFENWKII